MRQFLQTYARLKKKRFYCKALAGMSNFNISINSDMTVSCNCKDYDGNDRIGDLSIQSLPEVFSGLIASSFRSKLASGKLPSLTCTRCVDLGWTPSNKARYHLRNYTLPVKGVMVENTVMCNLRCLGCDREKVLGARAEKQMSIEQLKKISLMLRKHRIEKVQYYKFGEPFLKSNILEELRLLQSDNPGLKINICTNGLLVNNDEKREAALLANQIIFSIDGISDEVVRKYQVGGDFRKAYRNMSDLVTYRNSRGLVRPTVEWKYVLFNWNDKEHMIEQAIDLAQKAGVDLISFLPTLKPFYGISLRYYLGKKFDALGEMTWKGREIRLC